MRWLRATAPALACLAIVTVFLPPPARASLLITIDKANQRMIVARDDLPVYDWPVSTGRRGYDTPVGDFKPFRMEKDHFSREWDDAPMPNSIFFTQEGHAIHGSFDVKRLGSPASHGCVRLSPQNAATLFALVKQEKMANTRVVLTGAIPGGSGVPQVRRAPSIDPYGDDGGFTVGLAPPKAVPRRAREEAQPRPPRTRPAYFDGRYYYDRNGRRLYGAEPAFAGRDYDDRSFSGYERPRPRGLFER